MDHTQMTQKPKPTSTLHRNPRNSRKNPNLGANKKTGRNMKVRSRKQIKSSEEDDDDDEVVVEQKIVALQRIVPGGEEFGADKLFEETAGYIMSLQWQVKAMRALASYFEGLEKEKRMHGG